MTNTTKNVLRWLFVVGLASVIVGVWWNFRDKLSLTELVQYEQSLRGWQRESPLLVVSCAFLLYAAVTGLSIPAATVLTLLYAWYFRFGLAVVVISFSSTTGATIAFLLSRFLLRDWVLRKYGDRLVSFNAALERDGGFYLFTLRLQPAVPFFIVNAVMGVTPLRVSTFWWVSQLGMLPATCVVTYVGSTAPDLATLAEQGTRGLPVLQMTVALTLLGVLPLVTRLLLRGKSRRTEVRPNDAPREHE